MVKLRVTDLSQNSMVLQARWASPHRSTEQSRRGRVEAARDAYRCVFSQRTVTRDWRELNVVVGRQLLLPLNPSPSRPLARAGDGEGAERGAEEEGKGRRRGGGRKQLWVGDY